MLFSLALLATLGSASAGTIIWDGRFNNMASSAALNTWSFSNEVGPYQYYIHGPGAVTKYVNLDPAYKNPADSGSSKGAKITLDSTAYWNGQNMRRTELIPQTTAPINKGKVYYHFSMKRSAINPPSIYREHQMVFFESHFTEMKAGWISGEPGTSDNLLRWDVGGVTHWSTVWTPDVWHNVAYGIDFAGGSVEFWHSTGADPLTLTVPAVKCSASSNGADWHLGVLELPVSGQADTTEDFYFSGVYIESGSVTTGVAGPGGVVVPVAASSSTDMPGAMSSATAPVAAPPAPVPTTMQTVPAAAPTDAPAGPAVPKYGQCGGVGWSGATSCADGSTCTASGMYYSQCL